MDRRKVFRSKIRAVDLAELERLREGVRIPKVVDGPEIVEVRGI